MKFWIKSLLFLVLFSCLSSLYTQEREPLISEIRFQGLVVTDYQLALEVSGLRPGDAYNLRGLNRAIKNLTALQRFKRVDATTANSPGGITVTFTVEEESIIGKIEFKGVGITKRSKVKELVDLSAGRAFKESRARNSVYKIKEYYASEGFLDAKVEYEIQPYVNNPLYYRLVFSVVEGSKITVRDIQFNGAVKVKPRKLSAVMQTRKRLWIFRSGVLKPEEFLADRERLIALYKKLGYYDVEITRFTNIVEDIETTNKSGEITKVERGIRIFVDIEEGEQYTMGNIAFEGYQTTTLKELENFLTIKPGEVYDQEKIDTIRTGIYKKYADNGYLYANVSVSYQEDKEKRIIDTVYVISEGKRAHINNIIITGNTRTYPSVIRHLIQVSEGEIYVNRKLEQSYNRLGQTQFFRDIRVMPRPLPTDSLIDLEFVVSENQTGQIEFNAGWGTVSGFSVGMRISERNLAGRGWYLGLKGEYGEFRQLGEITFTNPFIFLSPFSFSVILGVYNTIYTAVPTDENNDGFIDGTTLNYINNPTASLTSFDSDKQYTRLNFRAGFSFGLQFWVYWNATLGFDFNIFLDYQNNFNRPLIYEGEWRLDEDLVGSFGTGWTIQNTLYGILSFNNTDGGLWPTRGLRSSLYIGFSGAGLGGNIHYINLTYSFDFYFKLFTIPSFGKDLNVTWVFHYDMGFLFPYGPSGLFTYRSANRLSFDGVYKMRGWINYTLRGEATSFFSMELRFPVWDFIGLIGFMDIGSNVGSYRDFTWATSSYIMSMGLGLAINLPVLPIRLYVARPFEWKAGTFQPTDSGNFWEDWQFVFSVQGLF